ncbi:hypothetical protein [Flagellimonas hadalis]|uniref:Late embryogenesis abundant protein LEA-2 subgroup domain-containing protein n=1 Tax=Flagellimonas hadalis TaxID=2597517 RepID=A0A5N5IUH4_9FLAO|nr:hypothetical protein [Allomuricauda hadalis]KAB5491415.1 hypothetical protein FOT42_000250 [Allomuricauda hadalis]
MKKCMLAILIITLMLGACSMAEPVFVSNDNLQFKGVSDSTFLFSVDARVYNPTHFKYQLKELVFDINYDNEMMGNGNLVVPKQLTPKDTTSLPFQCNLSLAQLQKKHGKILAGETVDFYFVGEAFAVHPIKKIKRAFEIKIPYNIKNFIGEHLLDNDVFFDQIEIERINPFSLGNPTNSTMRVTVTIQNKQSFDYKIEKIQLSLKSKRTNRVVLKGVLDSIIDSPSLKTVKVPLDVETDNLNLLHNLSGGLFNDETNKYIGSGYVMIRIEKYGFQIPFSKEFDINGYPFGSLELGPGFLNGQPKWTANGQPYGYKTHHR